MNFRALIPAAAGFVLAIVSVVSYFTFFVRFPATREFPWINLGLLVAGVGLAAAGLRRVFRQGVGWPAKSAAVLLAAGSAAILGLFLFFNFSLASRLPAADQAPGVGQKAPDFTLPDQNNRPVTLAELHGGAAGGGNKRWAVLVFYRGYW